MLPLQVPRLQAPGMALGNPPFSYKIHPIIEAWIPGSGFSIYRSCGFRYFLISWPTVSRWAKEVYLNVYRFWYLFQTLSSNNTREDSTHGHHQMVNTEIRLIIFLQPKMEKFYTVSKCDWELTVAQIMNSSLPNSDLNWRKWGKPLDHSGVM